MLVADLSVILADLSIILADLSIILDLLFVPKYGIL